MADFSSVSFRPRPLGLCALAAGLIAVSIVGCVQLLDPQRSDATYYLLDRSAQSASSTDTTGLKVGLRQPRLASYLDSRRMVTRRGPTRIQFAEFHRWGEDLNQSIGRTVALALGDQPGIQSAELVPWPKGVTFDYLVQLHVLSFEGVGPAPRPEAEEDASASEGHSRMVVQWTILSSRDDTILAREFTRHRETGWPVDDYQALASNLSTSLDVLADEIGTRLKTLDRP